jgi:hypothetical protein
MQDYQTLRRCRELFFRKLLAEEPNHPWGKYLQEDGALPHYKNGREARVGDKVVLFPTYGPPIAGILYDITPGNNFCNGKIAPTSPSDTCPNLRECLHFDDVKNAVIASGVTFDNKDEPSAS